MVESLQGPEQQIEAVYYVRKELDKRNLAHIENNLQFVKGTFPGVVEDVEKLSQALVDDGLGYLSQEGLDGFGSPSSFLGSIDLYHGQGRLSPENEALYAEIQRKYFSTGAPGTRQAMANYELGRLFDSVFLMANGNILGIGEYQGQVPEQSPNS